MALTVNTAGDLRAASNEARTAIKDLVVAVPGVSVADVYAKLASDDGAWRVPAVRSALWDLIAEGAVVIRKGNALHPPGDD